MTKRSKTSRRDFLRGAAMTAASVVGAVGAPKFSFAQEAGGKTLIKVFQRGGADGLHLFPRSADTFYHDHRPNIGIPVRMSEADFNGSIDLGALGGGQRFLNPNLWPLLEIWDSGRMLVAPSTAIEEGNRSHFDCQRWIGTGLQNNVIDGYLNRYLQAVDATDHPIRGAVLGKSSGSTEMRGPISSPVINTASSFNLTNGDFCSGSGCADNRLTDAMREIASHQTDLGAAELAVRQQQIVMLDAIGEIQAAGTNYVADAGSLEGGDQLDYSNSDLGRGLRLVAQLIKAGVPLSVAALDWNIGWDTHSNQIADTGNPFSDQGKGYHQGMLRGATDFLTFWRDMADHRDDVVVLVGTEFGRTVIENGSQGTDHGHGGAWFAFGGTTAGGMAPDVESLDRNNLRDTRYMPTAVDYRDLVGEIMVRHMGLPENLLGTVLPNFNVTDRGFFARTA